MSTQRFAHVPRSGQPNLQRRKPLTAMLLFALAAPVTHAAIITVDTSDDGSSAGRCTLRDAVTAANTDAAVAGCAAGAGADSIRFTADIGTITLLGSAGGTLNITDELTLDGEGRAVSLTRDASDMPFRILESIGDVSLHLAWIKLSGGSAVPETPGRGGGGVLAAGPLTLSHSEVSGNVTSQQYGRGGGINAYSTLDLVDSVVSGNATVGPQASGGGLYAYASATLLRSVVSGNATAGSVSCGGGIGLLVGNTLELTESKVSGNSAFAGSCFGGGICASLSNVILRDSTVSDNTTFGSNSWGGGGYAYTLTMIGSTVSGNSTNDYGSPGGGFFATFATLSNSTVSGNSTAGEGSSGGGLVAAATLQVNNSTIVANSAANATGGGVAIFSDQNFDADFNSSLVFANTAASGPNMAFAFDIDDIVLTIDGGHNLIGDVAANVTLPADTLTCDPQLQPLAPNGGRTMTHALGDSSCALDVGSNPDALEFDQRGSDYVRTFGDGVDIGAYERQPVVDPVFANGFETN